MTKDQEAQAQFGFRLRELTKNQDWTCLVKVVDDLRKEAMLVILDPKTTGKTYRLARERMQTLDNLLETVHRRIETAEELMRVDQIHSALPNAKFR